MNFIKKLKGARLFLFIFSLLSIFFLFLMVFTTMTLRMNFLGGFDAGSLVQISPAVFVLMFFVYIILFCLGRAGRYSLIKVFAVCYCVFFFIFLVASWVNYPFYRVVKYLDANLPFGSFPMDVVDGDLDKVNYRINSLHFDSISKNIYVSVIVGKQRPWRYEMDGFILNNFYHFCNRGDFQSYFMRDGLIVFYFYNSKDDGLWYKNSIGKKYCGLSARGF